MKREFLESLGLEKDVIDKVMAENGKDINSYKDEVETLTKDLTNANDTLTSLGEKVKNFEISDEASKAELEKALKTISDYEQAENQRKENEAKAQIENDLISRFTSVSVDKDGKPLNWHNELIKDSIFNKFKASLSDEANKGKGDKDILSELMSNQEGLLKTNIQVNSPSVNNTGGSNKVGIPTII